MSNPMSRRDLFKMGGVAAAGVAGASMLSACSPKTSDQSATKGQAAASGDGLTPYFLVPPEPITDFIDTKDYDIVVVGAGVAGMAAAMTAAEEGAHVAVVQKESIVISQGNMAASVDPQTSEAAKQALISYLIELSAHRADRSLLEAWANNSYEAIGWFKAISDEGGVFVNDDEPQADRVLNINGYDVYLHANTYFGQGHGEVVKAQVPYAESIGVEFFYEHPAVQLVNGEDGSVTGVVCENEEGYVLFNASKGVILATGDYCNDADMVKYYCPDCVDFPPYITGRTGDGHKMGVWAGGEIEPIGHTKMMHDARVCRVDAPLLLVNTEGKRILCEGPMQGYLNNYVREVVHMTKEPLKGMLYTVCDSKWQEQIAEWKSIDPEIEASNATWYWEGNTLEEAVEAMHADPDAKGYELDVEGLKATVERYNELCSKDADDDFGKNPVFMRAIENPPYIIVPRDFGNSLTVILGGLLVNADNQVLKAGDHTPIKGLFAVGNCSGCFYGGADYPMDVLGLSIGRAITSGRLAGKYAAAL